MARRRNAPVRRQLDPATSGSTVRNPKPQVTILKHLAIYQQGTPADSPADKMPLDATLSYICWSPSGHRSRWPFVPASSRWSKRVIQKVQIDALATASSGEEGPGSLGPHRADDESEQSEQSKPSSPWRLPNVRGLTAKETSVANDHSPRRAARSILTARSHPDMAGHDTPGHSRVRALSGCFSQSSRRAVNRTTSCPTCELRVSIA